jgi:hypothetical protein
MNRWLGSVVDFAAARAGAISAAGIVIMLGMWSRRWLAIQPGWGWLGEQLGTVLWGVMWYALLRVVAPKATPRASAAGALAITLGIELFQLTGIPGELNTSHRLWGLALGTSFDFTDLVMCALGVIVAASTHAQFTRKRSPHT